MTHWPCRSSTPRCRRPTCGSRASWRVSTPMTGISPTSRCGRRCTRCATGSGPRTRSIWRRSCRCCVRGLYYEGWRWRRRQTKERTRADFLEHVRSELPRGSAIDPSLAARAVFGVMWAEAGSRRGRQGDRPACRRSSRSCGAERVEPRAGPALLILAPQATRELGAAIAARARRRARAARGARVRGRRAQGPAADLGPRARRVSRAVAARRPRRPAPTTSSAACCSSPARCAMPGPGA